MYRKEAMIKRHLEQMTKGQLVETLDGFLNKYLSPSFGALPKREVDLEVLEALVAIGYVDDEPKVYDLITNLRVTRSKARGLLYDRELRRLEEPDLNKLVVSAVTGATPHKDGDLFVLEVENPYALDHLRHLVQQSGHASDGSFSSSIIRLSLVAYADLVETILDDSQKDKVKAGLTKAGAPEKSFKGLLKGALKKLGAKVADEAGAEIAEGIGGYVGAILSDNAVAIAKKFGAIFDSKTKTKRV
ncbi:MAG: hypothetical protein GY835_02275 [bacterium]|nr:hypothetical protein [bacterium]